MIASVTHNYSYARVTADSSLPLRVSNRLFGSRHASSQTGVSIDREYYSRHNQTRRSRSSQSLVLQKNSEGVRGTRVPLSRDPAHPEMRQPKFTVAKSKFDISISSAVVRIRCFRRCSAADRIACRGGEN